MCDLSKSCRTCMKEYNDATADLYHCLFSENLALRKPIAEILKECTTLQIVRDDELPQLICQECVQSLCLFQEFVNKALDAESAFRQIVISRNENIKHEYEYLQQTPIKNENSTNESFGAPSPTGSLNLDYEEIDVIIPKKETEDKKCFIDKKLYSKHNMTHKEPLLCPECGRKFRRQSALDKHLAKHERDHLCSICLQKFRSESDLVQHMTEHAFDIKTEDIPIETDIVTEIINQYQCPECEAVFSKKNALANHIKCHVKSFYNCDTCGKDFTNRGLLKRHVKLHTDDRPYECKICPKKYSRQDQLNDHTAAKHEGIKNNVCTYCNKAFSQLCSLKDHIRTHTGETPYLCSECGKGFSNSSNLRQHLLRHAGVKPFACSLCPKTFCTKGQMTTHVATHSGAHPYSCERCGAAFTKPNSLKKHQMIHLGLKPFACDACPKRFSCKDHLKRHTRIHTGEKPYRCSHCERAFTQSNDLVKHLRCHVGQNIYQCTVCNQRFRLQSELNKHYPTHYISQDQSDATLSKHIEADTESVKEQAPAQATTDGMITITFNSNILDKNMNGDITINIVPNEHS